MSTATRMTKARLVVAHCRPLQGRCWVEGDNAEASGDSRNMYGPVSEALRCRRAAVGRRQWVRLCTGGAEWHAAGVA